MAWTSPSASSMEVRNRTEIAEGNANMTDRPTAETFAPHVGKAFRPVGRSHVLTLVSVDTARSAGSASATSVPFALLLRGPRDAVLPEGYYSFAVDGGYDADLYIAPVHTPSRDHQDYQVVFN